MQQSATGMYTVQSGDSLQSITKKVWGDASLWYMLADANGMTQSATLAEGQQLTLPAVNSNVHNNSDTFKPYNPSDVVGSTDAEAVAPPSPDGGCGMVGMILMIVVAVVVTIYTAGAASGLIGAALSSGTTVAAVGAPAAAVAGATASAAAISASTGAMLAAGAIGGMAGSLASQVVGNMTGNVKGINWKGVAQGGLAGLVGGLASGLGNSVQASNTLGQVALRSSAQVAGNYLVNKALYNQSFSWKVLVAGVAGSMAGSYAGDIAMPGLTTGAGQFAKNAFSSFAGGYTENRARVWMDVGGTRTTEQLLTDAFGNAIGNSMAGVHVKAAEKERMKQGTVAANAYSPLPNRIAQYGDMDYQGSKVRAAFFSDRLSHQQRIELSPELQALVRAGKDPFASSSEKPILLASANGIADATPNKNVSVANERLRIMPIGEFTNDKMFCVETSHDGRTPSTSGHFATKAHLLTKMAKNLDAYSLISTDNESYYYSSVEQVDAFQDGVVGFGPNMTTVHRWQGTDLDDWHFTSTVMHPVTHQRIHQTTDANSMTIAFDSFDKMKTYLGMEYVERAAYVLKDGNLNMSINTHASQQAIAENIIQYQKPRYDFDMAFGYDGSKDTGR